MSNFTKIMAVAATTLAFGAGSAAAQSPTDTVYNPNGGVLDVVETATPAPTQTAAPESDVQDEATTPTQQQESAAPETTPAPATPTTQTQEASTGDLPFTGFEAGFVALAGLALLGGGLAMRRAAREQ